MNKNMHKGKGEYIEGKKQHVQMSKDDQDGNDLIKFFYQFLRDHNFEIIAKNFMEEAIKRGYTNSQSDLDGKNEYIIDPYEAIFSHYKSGDWENFFQLWHTLVPVDIKASREYQILMLKLHVYFATMPKRILSYQKHRQIQLAEDAVMTITCSNQINLNYKRLQIEETMDKAMRQLKEYLTTDGKELEHETQFKPFFALPYIEDPLADPFLSQIFEPMWVEELTMNLQKFTIKHKKYLIDIHQKKNDQKKRFSTSAVVLSPKYSEVNISHKTSAKRNVPIIPNDRNIPIFSSESTVIHQPKPDRRCCSESKYTQTYSTDISVLMEHLQKHEVCDGAIIDSDNIHKNNKTLTYHNKELALTKSHLHDICDNYEKLKSRFHKLHSDFHKLIGVAGELTVALEDSVRGQNVDLQFVLGSCMKLFPDLFSKNIRHNSQLPSVVQLEDVDLEKLTQSLLDITPISPKLLDFKKIKLHLISGNVKTRLFLLQALRWKITLSESGECDEVINEYITSDLLGIHAQIANDCGKSILPYLFSSIHTSVPQTLQQSAARLLNAIASIRCGRDYLSVGRTLVDVMFQCLNASSTNMTNSLTYDMMLAILQKLSLRRQQRLYMIETGLTEWLIYHLHSEHQAMHCYRLKYATALLMNLSLHRQAQIKASSISSLVISTLLTLLSLDYTPVLPYVTGTLNNFLSNHIINEDAKRMKLSLILECYGKQKPREIRQHFNHILKIHKREYTNNTEDEETADDDNEELDVLEEELEKDDPVKSNVGELYGEALLVTYYTIVPNAALEQNTKSSSINSLSLENDHCNTSWENSKATTMSSVTLASNYESGKTEADKLSSIASLYLTNTNNETAVSAYAWKKALELDKEQEAFLAKPKISRTPT